MEGENKVSRNKMDIINFSKIYDMFGEKAARDTLEDVNSGRVRESVIEKYLYTDYPLFKSFFILILTAYFLFCL